MTKEEALKVFRTREIWDLMDLFTTDELQEMIDAIVSTHSLPFNLDEAAEKYSENILANNEDLQDAIEDAFIAGAEWMAGQGYAREVEVKEDAGGYPYIQSIELYDYDKDEPLFKPGDKVIIQIRKGDIVI